MFELEGLDDFGNDVKRALAELTDDAGRACVTAADAAISAMQLQHPYQDRTYRLSGGMGPARLMRRSARDVEAVIRFKAKYAACVDAAKPPRYQRDYNFTRAGLAVADAVLDQEIDAAVNAFLLKAAGY